MTLVAESAGVKTWVEPFVGGANMIDKVPSSYERIGYDLNDHVIHALIDIRDNSEVLPDNVSESEYKSYKGLQAESITSWVRIACAYGGIFEGVMARGGNRNYTKEAKNNALKQSPKIQNVQFICDSYENLSFTNTLIYCDPPYQGTAGYKTGEFDHEKFFDWCREQAKRNIVFVSEYNAPDDFIEVWRGEIKTNFFSNRKSATHKAVERLFIVIDNLVTKP